MKVFWKSKWCLLECLKDIRHPDVGYWTVSGLSCDLVYVGIYYVSGN